MLNLDEHEISIAHKNENDFSCFETLNVVFILLINDKMPTIIGILTFMSIIKGSKSPNKKIFL